MDALARIVRANDDRPASAVPFGERHRASPVPRPLSSNDAIRGSSNDSLQGKSDINIDHSAQLSRAGPSVVKSRSGSVLSRGFILKTDYYPSGRALDLELNLQGAPNFRACRPSTLNVYGVAQPRIQGLKAILSLLRCRPNIPTSSQCVWISTREEPIIYIHGRSFVLRDSTRPRDTLSLSDRAENLEAIEDRLKADILTESNKYGGLILTHNEISEDSAIEPTWTAVDSAAVQTAKEVWQSIAAEGWKVKYHRVPIGPERLIEDNYLDAYVRILDDPLMSADEAISLVCVINCALGVRRSTFAMIAACLIRRKQFLKKGLPDPFEVLQYRPARSTSGTSTPPEQKLVQSLEQANLQQELSRSLLKLTSLLQQNLPGNDVLSVTQTLVTQPSLLENLRKAHQGNYDLVLSLLGCIDDGLRAKRLVDRVIDSCDQVTHLREEILAQRLKYSLTRIDENVGGDFLRQAVKALEKYFFLIAFASYVEDRDQTNNTFDHWLKARDEIWNQIQYLRTASQRRVLAPVSDLSRLSVQTLENINISTSTSDMTISGGRISGDEFTDHVVQRRAGIILRANTVLKSDQWHQESQDSVHAIRGVINFRNIKGTRIYASGQPSVDAISTIISRICEEHPDTKSVVWITLREEPLVYINGYPYCLRRDGHTLRNMKDYGGISPSRLEDLEERLKADVLSELDAFGGRLLLHTESGRQVYPVWEEVERDGVNVFKDLMGARSSSASSPQVQYFRVPITAEQAPDVSDIDDLLKLIINSDLQSTAIVLNDQLGRGRSTMATIIVSLVQLWLTRERRRSTSAPILRRSITSTQIAPISTGSRHDNGAVPQRYSYQVINNVLRVIKNGLVVKDVVDQAIDRCAPLTFNLRDSIEDSRMRAEQATEDSEKKAQTTRGIQNLRRYFTLVLFQAYLESIALEDRQDLETFREFLDARPVFVTFRKDLLKEDLTTLKPLERVDVPDNTTLPNEVTKIVLERSGAVLASSTIIKSDYFSGLEKLNLPERIEGSPNFRFVSLDFDHSGSVQNSLAVCGSGMPTVQGLKKALTRLHADKQGITTVYWTSLREEPVVYISGKPYVLRLINRPLENVVATGVSTQTVETMESTLKADVCRELRREDGNLLLHDEVEERGRFETVPQWEKVEESDIMTPREVYESVAREGYRVNYDRIAITDEQAPLPEALAELMDRVNLAVSNHSLTIFNCQMGRGRTTTGMVVAALVTWKAAGSLTRAAAVDEDEMLVYDAMDGISEEDAYLLGEYKVILKIIGVLSHGKMAKRLADRAIDLMSAIQNLRKAVYDYKLKVDACELGSKRRQINEQVAFNYLYRYATLIVFANYIVELDARTCDAKTNPFPAWLRQHREITTLLNNISLE